MALPTTAVVLIATTTEEAAEETTDVSSIIYSLSKPESTCGITTIFAVDCKN